MGARIHTFPLGITCSYAIKDQGTILIDTGEPKKGQAFLEDLETAGIKPTEIQLIILTHGHWDHIGSVAEIKELTGAKVALHKNEKHWLEEGLKPTPPGVTIWGRITALLMSWSLTPFIHIEPAKVDIVLDDEELSLQEYGISGRIIHTPGHSSGSVSVLLETGEAFVGDMAMNKFPLRLSPGTPIYAEDKKMVITSWRQLLAEGVHTIYPAHGNPFPVDIIRKKIAKTKTR